MSLLDAGSRKVIVTYPDETLHEAAAKMLRNNIGRLPVVDRKDPRHVLGYPGRPGIMAARLRRLDEEHVREPGRVKKLSWGCIAVWRRNSGKVSSALSPAAGCSR